MKRDRAIDGKESDKTALTCIPALNKSIVICKKFEVKIYQDYHELNTLAKSGQKCKFSTREPKQNWHQDEFTPRESRRNAPTREQMRLFASNIKKLQQERIGAPSCA